MKKLFFLMVLTLGLFCTMWSQVSSYTFGYSTVTYTEITGGTQLGSGTTVDDNVYNANNIGFTFNYNGTGYTQFSVNANGFLAMGASVFSSYTAISSGSTNNIIAVNNHDLQGNAAGTIRYELLGTAPNRVLVVQWKDFRHYGATGDNHNFQIRLSETSNRIELVYGPFTQNASARTAQVGLRGAASTDFNNRTTTTNWAATTAGATNTATCTLNATVFPANGAKFTFNPPVATTPPNPAVVSSPANAATAIDINATLNWASGGGSPTGFRLFFGTNGGGTTTPTNIVNNIDMGLVATYDPNPNMTYLTTYYWQVVPYNANGNAASCPIWSFTTMADPTINTFPYAEGFEGAAFPPTGWLVIDNNADGDFWASSTTNPRTGTKCTRIYTDYNTANDDYLVTPPILLSGNKELSFWTRAHSTSEVDEISVLLSTTSPTAASFTQVLMPSTLINYLTYTQYVIDLSAYSGTVYIAFARKNAPADGWYLYLDDVEIKQPLPPNPAVAVSPTNAATGVSSNATLNWASGGGMVQGYELNFGTNNPPTNIANGLDMGLTTTYDPSSDLTYSTTYYWQVIPHNAVGEAVNCPIWSFTVMEDPTIDFYPYAQNFDGTWTGTPAAPLGWTVVNANNDAYTWRRGNDYIIPTHSVPYAAVGMGNNNDWLITPPIVVNEHIILEWWDRVESASYRNSYTVKVSTTNSNIGSFTQSIATYDCINVPWTKHSLDLSAYQGQTIYLAFHQTFSAATYYGFGIDDFLLRIYGPAISVSSNEIAFGNVQQGAIATLPLTVTNSGDTQLVVQNVESSNPAIFNLGYETRAVYLEPGENLTLNVIFTPTAQINYTGQITIISNDPYTNPPYANGTVINLTGTGVAPFAVFGADNYNITLFTEANETVSGSFNILGEGVLPLNANLTLAERDWSVNPTTVTGLPYGGEATINVAYTAADVSNINTATIEITTNEPMSPAGEFFNTWPPTGWNMTGGTYQWLNYVSGAASSARANFWSWTSGNTAYMTSSPIDLSSATTAELEFDWSHQYMSSYPLDQLIVEMSDDLGTWTEISNMIGETFNSADGAGTTAPGTYVTKVVAIPSQFYAEDVYVRFRAVSGYGPDLFIDNISYNYNGRSWTSPEPQKHYVNLSAYTVEPFDETNAVMNYRAISSINGGRTTDIPEYSWIDNVSEGNLFDWTTENAYTLTHSFNYMGTEVDTIKIPTYYYGYPYYLDFLKLGVEFNTNYVAATRGELERDENFKPEKEFIGRSIELPEMLRTDISTDMNVSLAPDLLFLDVYISEEEIGTVITWADEGFFQGQIILARSGDVIMNYKDISTAHGYFLAGDSGIGIRHDTEQLRYTDAAWTYANLKPEMSLRFYPAYDNDLSLPATLSMLEDVDGINNDIDTYFFDVRNYIPTGGEVLDVDFTSSAHIQTVENGNIVGMIPALDWSGVETLNYTVNVRYEGSREAVRMAGSMVVTVENVNDVPVVLNPIEDITVEDNLLEDFGNFILINGGLVTTTNLSTIFYDPDSGLNYSVEVSDPTKVTAQIIGTNLRLTSVANAFTYKPSIDYNEPVEITITATENNAAATRGKQRVEELTRDRSAAEMTVNVTIVQVNDAPTATTIPNRTINEDPTIAPVVPLSQYFTDVDGDPLTFAVTGNDNIGVTIIPNNTDPLHPTYTASLQIPANWNGQKTITFIANDGINRNNVRNQLERVQVSSTMLLTVNPMNDQPGVITGAPSAVVFAEDTSNSTLNVNSIFTDVDLDPALNAVVTDHLNYTFSGNGNMQVAIATNGTITFTPALNWNGNRTITFRATDVPGLYVEKEISVQVTPVNDAPVINLPDAFTFNEGSTLVRNFNQYITDVDGDPLTLTVAGNVNITVAINGLNVTFGTITPLYFGQETLAFVVNDGVAVTRSESRETERVQSNTEQVNIIVNYVNHAPQYSGVDYIALNEDFGQHTICDLDQVTSDIDIPKGYTNLTYSIFSFDANKIAAAIDADNNLIINSVNNANGLSTLRVRISDNDSFTTPLFITQNITVDLAPINDLPYFAGLPVSVEMAANGMIYLNLDNNVFDVDNANPVLNVTSPEGFVEVSRLPGYNYRFKLDATGIYGMQDSISLFLNDGIGADVTASILVIVAQSEPPYVTYMIPTQQFDEDFTMTQIVDLDNCFSDTDNPDSSLIYTATPLAVDGIVPFAVEIDDNNMFSIGSAVPNWHGNGFVEISCSDGMGRYAVYQNVAVNVRSINDLPELVDPIESVNVDEDNFVAYTPIDLYTVFNDVDGDQLNFTRVYNPQHVNVQIANGIMNVTPVADWNGVTQVTVRANDGIDPQMVSTTFTITVNPVFDNPQFLAGLDGSEIMVDINGQIIDFRPWINTHNQNNTVPVSFVLLGDIAYYDVVNATNSGIYAINVLPVGYQWAYPDQQLMLLLEGGSTATVTLVTNYQPYNIDELEDVTITDEQFIAGYNYGDMDNYFADPEGGTLTFTAVFNFTQVNAVIGAGNILMLYPQVGYEIYDILYNTPIRITVVANDGNSRETASQYFDLTISGDAPVNTPPFVTQVFETYFIENLEDVDINVNLDYYFDDLEDELTFTVGDYNRELFQAVYYDPILYIDPVNPNRRSEGQETFIFVIWADDGHNDAINQYLFVTIGQGEGGETREITINKTRNAVRETLSAVNNELQRENFTLIRNDGNVARLENDAVIFSAQNDKYSVNYVEVKNIVTGEVEKFKVVVEEKVDAEQGNVVQFKSELKSNYPNPFNPVTTIEFTTKSTGHVLIEVYNILGQKIKTLTDAEFTEGNHSVVWNGDDNAGKAVSSGVYFYKMSTSEYSSIKKMVMMK